jgi:hypothetical protein
MEPSSLAGNIPPPPLTPPPNSQPLVEEFVRRISDPQDLEDGLLATALAAMLDEVQKHALAAGKPAPTATPSDRADICSVHRRRMPSAGGVGYGCLWRVPKSP